MLLQLEVSLQDSGHLLMVNKLSVLSEVGLQGGRQIFKSQRKSDASSVDVAASCPSGWRWSFWMEVDLQKPIKK